MLVFQRMPRITPNGIMNLMKSFYTSYYRFYKPEQREKKIFAISDVHFNDRISDSLKAVLRRAEKDEPSLIVITGDLVHDQDALNTTTERARLKTWLEHLSVVAPICICLGNHDFFYNDQERGRIYSKTSILSEVIAGIPNVHLLDNSAYEDDQHYVFGFTLPPAYYGDDTNHCEENLPVLEEQISLIKNQFAKLPAKKTKLFLVHSPVHLNNNAVKDALSPFDLVLAGHMHNGVVPPILQDLWRKKRGLFAPSKEFFKDYNSRIGLYGDKLITLGAVTTVQPKTRFFGHMSDIFPTYLAEISTSHNTADERKPDIKSKYEKW